MGHGIKFAFCVTVTTRVIFPLKCFHDINFSIFISVKFHYSIIFPLESIISPKIFQCRDAGLGPTQRIPSSIILPEEKNCIYTRHYGAPVDEKHWENGDLTIKDVILMGFIAELS